MFSTTFEPNSEEAAANSIDSQPRRESSSLQKRGNSYDLNCFGIYERHNLPNNDKIRVLAISVAAENPEVRPGQPLYDMLGRTEPGPLQQAAR